MLNCFGWGMCAAFITLPFSLPLLTGVFIAASLVIWLLFPPTLSASARLIDKHYRFKDRIFTAFTLLRKTNRTPMEQLQIADAAEHLAVVNPNAVLSIRIPKTYGIAVAILIIEVIAMGVVEHFTRLPNTNESTAQSLPIDNAILRENIVKEAEELVQNHTDEPSLENLSEQLKTLVKKFDGEKMDKKESLVTLSEMEEALQSALDSLQLETMEASMQELAKTLELAEQMVPIRKALEKGEYSQAASELKEFASDMMKTLSKPERETIAKEMQTLAENAEKRSQKPLQEAAQKMSDALKNDDNESTQEAAEALASEMEKHSIRQGIGKDLANKQMQLGIMKADSGLAMSGGKNTDKSKTASETWGSGAAGNPNTGEETNLQGQRQQETLTGTLSEQGEALTETIDSQQETTVATSQQEYREQYQQYQKISEAVLDNEPIPMGQRQMIRRYFESIRPSLE